MTKVLTQLPLGMIKKFLEENATNIKFTDEAKKFFNENHISCSSDVMEELKTKKLIDIKDGKPQTIMDWLKQEYNVDIDLSGEYAIASILSLLLEFSVKSKEYNSESDDIKYGINKSAVKHIINQKECFSIPLTNKDFKLILSKQDITKELINKQVLENKSDINLVYPLVKYTEEYDLSEYFKGSMFEKDGAEQVIDSVVTKTLFDLGLDKVEVKQVASMMLLSGCLKVKETVYIQQDFFAYVCYKDELVFGTEIKKEDFIKIK